LACGNGDGGTGAHMVFPLFLLAAGCAKPEMKSTSETTSGGKEHR
jgi:predicted acyltransferase